MQSNRLSTALAATAALAIGACGGTTNHLTKQQYVKRAEAICSHAGSATAAARATLHRLPPPRPGLHPTASQLAQAAQAERTESAITTEAAAKLRALGTPTADAHLAKQAVAVLATAGADELALSHAAQSHNLRAVATAFASLRRDTGHLDAGASQLGVIACTQI